MKNKERFFKAGYIERVMPKKTEVIFVPYTPYKKQVEMKPPKVQEYPSWLKWLVAGGALLFMIVALKRGKSK